MDPDTARKNVRLGLALFGLALLLFVLSFLPACAGLFGPLYHVFAWLLGLAFIGLAVVLYRRADRRWALRTYLFSLAYLAALFAVMVVDVKV
jgi:protoheme IX farnesyltransferase